MAGATARPTQPLRVLVVDAARVPPALVTLLSRDPRVGEVRAVETTDQAHRLLRTRSFDLVLRPPRLPTVAERFPPAEASAAAPAGRAAGEQAQSGEPPAHTWCGSPQFVTLTPPLSAARLDEILQQALVGKAATATGTADGARPRRKDDAETVEVELAGRISTVSRSQVRFVEAQGDYARLHTASGSHLVRIPLAVLEERWACAGFVRIHRSTLVRLPDIEEIRADGGRWVIRIGGRDLPVSRRHARRLRDRLGTAAPALDRTGPGDGSPDGHRRDQRRGPRPGSPPSSTAGPTTERAR